MLREALCLPEEVGRAPLDAARVVWVAPPPVADHNAPETLSQDLPQNLFAPAPTNHDQCLAPGGEDSDPVPGAVHVDTRLVHVDHVRCPYPPEDSLVLGPQPAGHPVDYVEHSRRSHRQAVCPPESLGDLPVGEPLPVPHQRRLNQSVLAEPAGGRAVRVPRRHVGSALWSLVLVGEEVYHLPRRWVTDLLDDAVAHIAGLPQRRPSALAPFSALRRLNDVGAGPRPRPPGVTPGPTRVAPCAAVCVDAGLVGSLGWWGVGVLVGGEAPPELGVLLGEPPDFLEEPGAVGAGHSLQITRYALLPMYSLGQSTLALLPKGVTFFSMKPRISSSWSCSLLSFRVILLIGYTRARGLRRGGLDREMEQTAKHVLNFIILVIIHS